MTIKDTHPLIEQFRRIDAELEPAGLYAAEKQVLWSKVLFPVLKHGGGKISYARPGHYVHFIDGAGREGMAKLLSISAVKVRQFGDRFSADGRIDYHDRWDDRRIQKKICELWAKGDVRRIFMIVGFDHAESPFNREFQRLAQEVDWATHGVSHARKSWQDVRGRNFSCVVAVWENNPAQQT